MKNSCFIYIISLLLLSLYSSCEVDPSGDDLNPITGITIEEFISSQEDLTSFNYILQRSGYDRLMDCYGDYTCFAPSNDAIDEYLNELWYDDEDAVAEHNGMTGLEPSLEGLSDSLCTDIAEYHLVGFILEEADFGNSSLTFTTMLGRSVIVSFSEQGAGYALNDSALITYSTEYEDRPNNGIVHKISKVIPRSNRNVFNEMKKNADGRYSIFVAALELCGYDKILERTKKDKTDFTDAVTLSDSEDASMWHMVDIDECKVGFTVFAETDEQLAKQGITDLASLVAHANSVYGKCAEGATSTTTQGWYDYFRNNGVKVTTPEYTSGVDEEQFKDSCNALNMWLAYHILYSALDVSILTSEHSVWMQSGYTGDTYDYYETLLPKTLLKIWKVRSKGNYYINRYVRNNTLTDALESLGSSAMHEVVDGGFIINTGDVLQPINGYVYNIDGSENRDENQLLEYKYYVPKGVLFERMRMDALSLFPEIMNNGMRGKNWEEVGAMSQDGNGSRIRFPNDYFDWIKVYNGRNTTIDMNVRSKTGDSNSYLLYQGDSFQGRADYDIAFKMPPVPDGEYELRIDVTMGGSYFGMTQYYIGTSSSLNDMVAVDLPIDLRWDASDPRIGYVDNLYSGGAYSTEWEEDKGLAVDQDMRTRNWMRGPLSIVKDAVQTATYVCRYNNGYAVRRILVKQKFEQKDYWMRMKAVLSGNHKYQIDYVEFCPIDIAESEQYLEDMY